MPVVAKLPYGARPSKRAGVDHLFSLVMVPAAQSGDAGRNTRTRLRRFSTLYSESVQIIRTLDIDELFEVFESEVRRVVAEFSDQRVFVHAGVVGWRGRAIVIPGRSFSGKTSLVAELVRLGATYYSDEYAVVDARGRVHPFAKPLSIRESGDYRQTDRTVEELGGEAGLQPLEVGAVVVATYRDGARWAPRRLTDGNAALALLAHTVSARRSPAAALEALRRATDGVLALKGTRGDASIAAPAILEALDKQRRS